jgi:hypothetical protein
MGTVLERRILPSSSDIEASSCRGLSGSCLKLEVFEKHKLLVVRF